MNPMNQPTPQGAVASFFAELNELRWDDHRYYHQSRINQTLHFISSISFLTAYVMLFINPGVAALIGWGIGMVSRQSGHFFFEPRDYDHINKATHEHKEEIKVGYNLNRKRVLHGIWAAIPI
ncbi:Mpo1-like protein, partial [Oleiphilus sp. HI0066]|uniref:Mpo1-like protein n=3 Tax=Oleiphilus TaxID=141450 RepID=UPI000A995C38